jgi:hypothetical protein
MQSVESRGVNWREWFAVAVLALVAFGYFVVKPFVERVITGAGGLLVAVATAAAQAAGTAHDTACAAIERNAEAAARLGEPIRCAALEDVEWIEAPDPNHLEFKFAVEGPQGSGMARVTGKFSETAFEVTSCQLELADEVVRLELP